MKSYNFGKGSALRTAVGMAILAIVLMAGVGAAKVTASDSSVSKHNNIAIDNVDTEKKALNPASVNIQVDFEEFVDTTAIYSMLNAIENENRKVTVHVTGEFASEYPYVINDIRNKGHQIAINGERKPKKIIANNLSGVPGVNISKEFTLQETGAVITGIVTSSNGTPVAEAIVYSQGPGYVISTMNTTDINGNYRLEGLQAGNYIVIVTPAYGSNFISNSTIVHVSQNETVSANIILQTGGIITGIVTTSNGTPIANTIVYSQGSGYGTNTMNTTDINGNYRLEGLQAGNYIVIAPPPYGSNFISNSTLVHVSQGETVEANIILQTGSIITGIVTTSNGTPVTDAYVYAQGPGYGSGFTDINGNYRLEGLQAGNYIVIATPPYGSNFISNSTIVHVSQDETVSANIILQAGGMITGIVTASNGTPVTDAYIYAQGTGYGSGSTDINGNYRLEGLQAGNYIVMATPAYGSNFISNSTLVHVSQGETVSANIILQAGGIITGIVTASNGTPVANAYVYTSGPSYLSSSTDINGNYRLDGLQAGNYLVSATPPYGSNFISNSTIVHVSQGETVTANVILQTGGMITGIVTTSKGTPVANAYVYTSGPSYLSSSTDINGNYSLAGLQAGKYEVYAYSPYGNLALNSTNVTVKTGETSIANIILDIMAILPPSLHSVEIRGEVAEGPFLWDAYNFPAFFYDFQGDVKTETLNISYINGRIIPPGKILYSTIPEEVSFKYSNFGKYQVIGFMAEKYFAAYTSNTNPTITRPTTDFTGKSSLANGTLHKVLIDDDTKRTISLGGTIALKEGYVIKATDIDLNARTMLLSLMKDGSEVDISPLAAGETYVYSKTVSVNENLPLVMVRFENVFAGQELQVAFVKGLFQISENATSVKVLEQFGKMEITTVSSEAITMDNYLEVSLDKNTNINVLGNINLKVADNDSLRFYPFIEYFQPGKYEIRGPVFNGSTMFSLTGRTFGGFYYDLDHDRQSESLNFTPQGASILNRQIAKNELEYRTTKVPVEFKAYEKEKVNVSGTGVTTYDLVSWRAEKWVAIKGITNKIAKIALEMNKEEKKTMTTGETWSLGSGYYITINAIDARTVPKQVWFTLSQNGTVIDEQICQAPQSSSTADKEKALCYKTKTILGESDALLFTVYVDSIFPGAVSDMVQFKYAWLIDESSATEIKIADKFGVFEVRSVTPDYIEMSNEDTVNLSKNNETTLMGELKFKVADTDILRFYPKIDYVIGGIPDVTPIPTPTITPIPIPTPTPIPIPTLTPIPTPTSTPTPPIVGGKGDVDGDGHVSIVDALFITQYTIGTRTLSTTQLEVADVNDDGQVTIVDALFIEQYTVGLWTITGASPLISPVSTNPDTVSVGSVTLTPGNTGTFSIKVNSVATDMAAATVVLTFDPEVVTIDSVASGDLGVPIVNINNTAGNVAISTFTTSAATTAPVTIATVTLKGVTGAGVGTTSALNLTINALSDSNGVNRIPGASGITNGVATIGQNTGTVIAIQDASGDSNIYGSPNGVIPVSIVAKNVSNLAAGTIYLTYDPKVVNIVSVSEGDLGTVTENVDNNKGLTIITAFSNTGRNGNVTFANVELKAVGSISEISPLNLSVSAISDQNATTIPYSTKNGTVTISAFTKGDINGDGMVNVLDALLISQYTVGLRTFTPAQLTAADVNNDGQVTVVDALFLAQYTVGLRHL